MFLRRRWYSRHRAQSVLPHCIGSVVAAGSQCRRVPESVSNQSPVARALSSGESCSARRRIPVGPALLYTAVSNQTRRRNAFWKALPAGTHEKPNGAGPPRSSVPRVDIFTFFLRTRPFAAQLLVGCRTRDMQLCLPRARLHNESFAISVLDFSTDRHEPVLVAALLYNKHRPFSSRSRHYGTRERSHGNRNPSRYCLFIITIR